MSTQRRRPGEWLAVQMINAALHHPSVPVKEGFGAAWKHVTVTYHIRQHNSHQWSYDYKIELVSGQTVFANAIVQFNPDCLPATKSNCGRKESVFPVSCTFLFCHDFKSKNQYSFTGTILDGYLILIPKATVVAS